MFVLTLKKNVEGKLGDMYSDRKRQQDRHCLLQLFYLQHCNRCVLLVISSPLHHNVCSTKMLAPLPFFSHPCFNLSLQVIYESQSADAKAHSLFVLMHDLFLYAFISVIGVLSTSQPVPTPLTFLCRALYTFIVWISQFLIHPTASAWFFFILSDFAFSFSPSICFLRSLKGIRTPLSSTRLI